jgi:hypothetical protein
MYCAHCGSQIKDGLNYCSRCGAKITQIDAEVKISLSENLSSSLGYIGGFGLIGYIFVALILVKNHVDPTLLFLLSFLYLGALFGISYMILQQLRMLPGKLSAKNTNFQNDFQTGQLEAANTAQLEEPKQQPLSVTEHTTRTLDKRVRSEK